MKLNAIRVLLKKRVSKIVLAVVLCGVVAFVLISVLKPDSTPALQYQIATVKQGNLTVEISGSGNLALSSTQDLTFEMAGTVQEVLAEEGDSVEEGQVIARLDTSEWEDELATLELDLLQAKINVNNAELDLERAEENDSEDIYIKKLQLKLAKQRLGQKENALEEASEASPEVTAPFDGFVTKVSVSGGDEVKKGTVAVTLADPDKFEVDILVSEMDISEVEKGGRATLQADAISGISLPANVTYIAPTATIQSGVVNYKVTVEVQSVSNISQVLPSGMTPPAGQGNSSVTQPVGTFRSIQLREGLTVTVNIIVDQRTNVLLVPSGAITTQGWQSYVEVLLPDGTIERRTIKTGITDYVSTEVTDGLDEGEKVIVPQGTTTPTQQEGPGGGMFPGGGTFPGGGAFPGGGTFTPPTGG